MARSEPLSLFPIYSAGTVYEHNSFFVHTQKQTASGLWGEIHSIWQNMYYVRIANLTFNPSSCKFQIALTNRDVNQMSKHHVIMPFLNHQYKSFVNLEYVLHNLIGQLKKPNI